MSVQQTFNSFQFFDILADFIPGLLLLLSVMVLFETGIVVTSISPGLSLTIVAVLAYVLGHAIQWLMGRVGEAPSKFVEGMEALDLGEYNEVPFQVTEIEEDFLSLCRDEFDLSEDFDDYGTLFELLLSYLDMMPSSKGRRFQALFSFFWAMETVSVLIFLLSIASIGANILGLGVARSIPIGVTSAVLGLLSIIIFRDRKDKFERNFVEYVILDIYNYRVVTQNDNKPT